MTQISSERIASIEARKHELQQAMSRGDLSPDEFVRLSKDYAAIEPVAAAAREVRRLRAELVVLNGIVADPAAEAELKEMAATEAEEIRHKLPQAERALALRLLPRDAADERAAMLEVRVGTGRPVGQHDRQRGAHNPLADRPRCHPAGREVAAQE